MNIVELDALRCQAYLEFQEKPENRDLFKRNYSEYFTRQRIYADARVQELTAEIERERKRKI